MLSCQQWDDKRSVLLNVTACVPQHPISPPGRRCPGSRKSSSAAADEHPNTYAGFVWSPRTAPNLYKMQQFAVLSLVRSPWPPNTQHAALATIWGMLAFRGIVGPMEELPMGQSPIQPIKHTPRAALGKVTAISNCVLYSRQIRLVCGVRHYKGRAGLAQSDPQAIVNDDLPKPSECIMCPFKGPALATHSCVNKIGSNSNSYGLY